MNRPAHHDLSRPPRDAFSVCTALRLRVWEEIDKFVKDENVSHHTSAIQPAMATTTRVVEAFVLDADGLLPPTYQLVVVKPAPTIMADSLP